ncbi:hypothetical protein ASG90_18845 [Nocardioides sp. Soil797]|nr:hypothetical protein ASG90_18845 [Nocardioides sp. Soil797]
MVQLIHASGREALSLSTRLLQRVRVADPYAGVWEAADVQWAWRKPTSSDGIDKPFWLDDHGQPVAGVLLATSGDDCQIDPVVVPGAFDVGTAFAAALELGRAHAPGGFDIPTDDADPVLLRLVTEAGLTPGYRDSTAWVAADDRREPRPTADGYRIVDRTQRADAPHPMRRRNGEQVAQRLAECSLYDAELDLAVETTDACQAGVALFWADPVTRVGLVEPVRVEDEHQRRGLASALVSEGVARLFARGMERVKVSFGSEAAGATYRGVGFVPTSTTTWFGRANGSAL